MQRAEGVCEEELPVGVRSVARSSFYPGSGSAQHTGESQTYLPTGHTISVEWNARLGIQTLVLGSKGLTLCHTLLPSLLLPTVRYVITASVSVICSSHDVQYSVTPVNDWLLAEIDLRILYHWQCCKMRVRVRSRMGLGRLSLRDETPCDHRNMRFSSAYRRVDRLKPRI